MADARKTVKKAVATKKADSEKKTAAKPAAKKVTAAKPAAKATEKKVSAVKPAAKSANSVKTAAKTADKGASSALTGLMSSFLSDSSLSSVSGKAGVDSGNVAGILAAALPSLLNGANSQASSAETSESFFEAVNSHAGKNPEDVDVDEGQKIINHLLGSEAEDVKAEISRKTGLSSAKVGLVLAAAAPIIMNLLGKETASSHSSSGTASLLGSLLGGSSNSSSSNSLMTAALGSVLSGALGGNSYGNNSMLGSLLGGSSSSPASSLLGGLLGTTTSHSSNSSMASGAMGLLGSLLGSDNSHQQSSGSGLAGILSHLLK